MRPSRRDIVIATRRSRLATIQSQIVADALRELHPKAAVRLEPIESRGDQLKDQPLARFGGKGLFTKSIERALLDGRADVAVHSYKDLPTEATGELAFVATPPHAARHDVLITRGPQRIADLPNGATLGTCSPRREAQVRRLRPDLRVVPLRGSVETRMAKVLEEKTIDATLLAAAGLDRLGLGRGDDSGGGAVPVEDVLPAAGQGAMAVQVRLADHTAMRRCMPLNDLTAGMLVNAEREVVHALGADCHSPVAVFAEMADGEVRLRARVLSLDGATCLAEDRRSAPERLTTLCRETSDALLAAGAREVLEEAAAAAQA